MDVADVLCHALTSENKGISQLLTGGCNASATWFGFVDNARYTKRSAQTVSTIIDHMANFVYAEDRNGPFATAH
jgi:hypothetical protein